MFWGLAGLLWAGVLGILLPAGLILGLVVGVGGALIKALTTPATEEAARASVGPSNFLGLATVLVIGGAVIWLAISVT